MTAPALSPDAARCPDCRAPMPASPAPATCRTCGLALTGPRAARLWEVDTELLRLDTSRRVLLTERVDLLAGLHSGTPADPRTAGRPFTGPAAPLPATRAEWTPQRIQNLLLVLGGLLLAVAAVVFTAVTYDRLGAGGRAAVLLTLTLAAGAAAPAVRRRGLSATAETLGAVTLVLAALDAYGLRTLGFADSSDPLSYAAGSAAVLAVAAGLYAGVVPLRIVRGAAVVLAQLPALLLLARYDAPADTTALVLAGLAAVDLFAFAALREQVRVPRDVAAMLAISGGLASVIGTLVALVAADQPRPGLAATALLAHSAVLVGAAVLVQDRTLRAVLSGLPVPLLAVAAVALSAAGLPELDRAVVAAAASLVAALVAALVATPLLPAWRPGPAVGAVAVAVAALAAVADQVGTGLIQPLGWLADPWSLAERASAREAVGVATTWDGSAVSAVVLMAVALTVSAAGYALNRLHAAAAPTVVLAVAALVLLPLAFDVSFPVAMAMLLAVATAFGAAGAALLPHRPAAGTLLGAAGTAVALLTAAWSTADRDTTLVVLPLTAVLVGALSVARALPAAPAAIAVAVAGGLAAAALAAAGAAQELAADQIGGLLLLAVAGLLAVAALPAVGPARRLGAEIASLAAGLVAALLAVDDAGWLSWVLAVTGLLAIATGIHPDRRRVAAVGGLLLSASSWVRLADADVTAPEPYVLPLAVVALVLGHLRRKADPRIGSWTAYGTGLTLLLAPSLLFAVEDEQLTRPLLLVLAALVVLLVGARLRLQAPLAVGAGVLALDALQLLAPYAAALPRWMSLAAVGVLLVAVGATYEQRRRELSRLRGGYDALA